MIFCYSKQPKPTKTNKWMILVEQLQEASVMILRFKGQRDKHVTHTGNKLELGLPLPGG